MLLVVLSGFFILPVLSEVLGPPPPPQDIQVDKWLLTWTPAATEEGDVTYTVQYRSFDHRRWLYVPTCIHTPSPSCNITAAGVEGEHGCMSLRVQAERRGLNSSSVEACSQHGDTCSPEVRLTEQPGSLTVRLGTDHGLYKEYAAAAKHRVYYGKEGTPLEDFEDTLATVSIPDLEEGQRYCVRIQYTVYDDLVGLPSCPRCVLIPEKESQTALIASLVVVVLLVILIPLIAYVLLYHKKNIKLWIQPPCRIPDHFLEIPEPRPPGNTSCSTAEHYDVMSPVPRETHGSRTNPEDEAIRCPLLSAAAGSENCGEEELEFSRRVV